MPIKPLLKWAGGKTQIVDKVIEQFPKSINNYREIFVGGGSVLIKLLEKDSINVTGYICAYDLNNTLIHFYRNIRDNHKEVFKQLSMMTNIYKNIEGKDINRKPKTLKEAKTSKESYYYWVRKNFNNMKQKDKNTPKGSAMFLFLNKTCFRGLYREGPNGFNVPFGHYDCPEIGTLTKFKKFSELIENVKFHVMDFEESLKCIKKGDFVYLDPPYVPENEKSFTKYNNSDFSLKQHKKLFAECKKIPKKGAHFLLSNSKTDLVTSSFKNFKIIEVECKRRINSKKPQSKTKEVLVKSGYKVQSS